MLVACSKDTLSEPQGMPEQERRALTVSFDDEETRIQLNEATKTVWTKGDRLSVFYGTTTNEEWQFTGDTGDRTGEIVPVDGSFVPTATSNEIVVVYPYNENYTYNSETHCVEATMPTEQTYLEDSYGLDGNIMVWHGEQSHVSLKSVCGWLKLQLTGAGQIVESITLRGNNDEQVAGKLSINTLDASSSLLNQAQATTEVTLNCTDGVELGTEATAFYIALPPMTFSNGLTVEVECSGYEPMAITTSKQIIVERNAIQPMAAVEFEAEHSTGTGTGIPNNEIWYTATTKVEPYDTSVFGVEYISNVWDSETGKGVMTFSGDVTTIGEYAFYGYKTTCSNLTSITLPDSVTSIELCAFLRCTSLTSIHIPDSVTTIGGSAFARCESLTSIDIPDSVTTIQFYTFDHCKSLTNINIPDSVTTIEYGAFMACYGLTSVDIPDNVTSLGYQAFESCQNLKSVTIGNGLTIIEDYTFRWCRSLTDVTIGNNVTTLGNQAFTDCESLTSITIPSCVTTIMKRAFYRCSSLVSVSIPDSVTSIGADAFYECNLTSLTIPDSVIAIGSSAFAYNKNLTDATIGAGVTTIGDRAFWDCTSLISVYCKPTTPPVLDVDEESHSYTFCYLNFGEKPIGCIFYVPSGSVDAYKAAWPEYAEYIE